MGLVPSEGPDVPMPRDLPLTGLNNARHVEETNTLLQLEPEELSLKRDVLVTENGGSVTFNPSFASEDVIGVETDGNDPDSKAALETAKLVDYRAGHRNEVGMRVRLPDPPGAGVAEWGLGSDAGSNRMFFRQYQRGAVSAVIERDGVETEVSERLWSSRDLRPIENENGEVEFWTIGYDPWDAGSTLGTSVDTSRGYIYKIDYGWYGQSLIVFSIVTVGDDGSQRKVPCAGLVPVGNTSLTRINHPIFVRADNQGTQGQTQVAVAGRQAWYTGRRRGIKTPVRHVITDPPAISNSSYTTITLFRRHPDFDGSPADLVDVSIAGGGTYDVEARGRVDAASDPTWTTPNRDTQDPVPLQVDESTDVGTDGSGELTGYPTGGGLIDAQAIFNAEVGTLESQTTALVRDEPGGVVAREVSSGSATTPDAVALTFRVAV